MNNFESVRELSSCGEAGQNSKFFLVNDGRLIMVVVQPSTADVNSHDNPGLKLSQRHKGTSCVNMDRPTLDSQIECNPNMLKNSCEGKLVATNGVLMVRYYCGRMIC